MHLNEPLVNALNLPASECCGNAVYVGPTAVDMSPIDEADRQAMIRQSDAKILAAYRKRDLAHYSGQTKPWHRPR